MFDDMDTMLDFCPPPMNSQNSAAGDIMAAGLVSSVGSDVEIITLCPIQFYIQ